MRFALVFALLNSFLALAPRVARAGRPQLLLDVVRFRNPDQVQKGAEIEIYVTVPTQLLTYRQRAPKQFQSAAVVTLEVLKADGKPAYQETITLKPPTLSDTTISLKNPLSFLKRVPLPDGRYTLRGRVRDLYRPAGSETAVEQQIILEAPKGPSLSDVLLLARPAVKTTGDETFVRNGYLLTRAPGGLYGRGADNLYFYTELTQLPAGQPVRLHYHLAAPDGSAADADAPPLTAAGGRPTVVVGQLPLGPLPDGEFTLTVEVRDADKKLLAVRTVRGQRSGQDFAPAGAAAPR